MPVTDGILLCSFALCACVTALGDVYARMPHGAGFRNVRDYGAKGDGISDDTAAFIRALEEGRGERGAKAPVNVYVPPGTYLIRDTLILWRATMLAGDADNPPTLLLADNAPGFGDPQSPRPLLVTACGYDVAPETRDWHTRTREIGGNTNDTFYVTVRHLNIKLGRGNPGAWGIYWLVAQQTALRHVTIDAGEGQGCIRSMWWGGGGVISHVTLLGGDYGWHVVETSQFVLRSAQFRDQRKASLWLDEVWNFALLDLHLRDTAPVRALRGSVSLVDCSFGGMRGEAAIEAPGTDLVLQNVVSDGTLPLTRELGPARFVARHVIGAAMVDGQALSGEVHDLSDTLAGPPEPLPSPAYPVMSWHARSVTEFGAKGDGVTDDTQAIQRALSECAELFFPQGTYVVRDTLILQKHTRLFGEMWSVIELAEDSPGFEDPTSQKPMITVPEDPTATVTLCHLWFRMLTPGGIHCDWRAGQGSMLIDTTFYSESQTQQLNWRISGPGGGFFENGWSPGVSGDGLEITSTGRKWLYAVQQEHYRGTALRLRGARHLTGLVLQFETSSRYVHIEDCEDITVFQTIAGNWEEHVPSLVHVIGGRRIALFNSAMNRNSHVITEEPNGWNAGGSDTAGVFVRQAAWVKR